MTTSDQLRTIITNLESDRIERTTTPKDRTNIRQAICAFANDLAGHGLPGFFLIGVDDKGSLSGLTCYDDLLKDLASIRAEGRILPLPTMEVYCHSFDEGDVAVIEVQPSQVPPVRYDGRIWIRIGPTKAVASPEDERRLMERASASTRTFDAQPALDADTEDLALDLFTLSYRNVAIADDVLAENNRPLEQQLAALGFLDRQRGTPTNAGVLLFGKDPRRTLPGAYVQLVRIAGPDLTGEIVLDDEVSGDLASVIREVEQLLKENGNPPAEFHLESHSVTVDVRYP